jgi:hypothetical protein
VSFIRCVTAVVSSALKRNQGVPPRLVQTFAVRFAKEVAASAVVDLPVLFGRDGPARDTRLLDDLDRS